ncbi:hypothetical protein ACFFNA_39570, partial [Mesorhizobium kowhaii]|uniref:hypothetical protein n=1 Tax=Mesorhizobium kowhaii TaxID=1300272 RepID=UPI0035F0F3B5
HGSIKMAALEHDKLPESRSSRHAAMTFPKSLRRSPLRIRGGGMALDLDLGKTLRSKASTAMKRLPLGTVGTFESVGAKVGWLSYSTIISLCCAFLKIAKQKFQFK